MLLVPTRCDRSHLHGLGLFAVHPIPSGTPIWRFEAGFDRRFSESEVASLPHPARQHLEHYGSFHAASRTWSLGGDLSIFMNHASSPNTGAPGSRGPATETVALRDIAAGEEITCNYHDFDDSPKPVPAPPM